MRFSFRGTPRLPPRTSFENLSLSPLFNVYCQRFTVLEQTKFGWADKLPRGQALFPLAIVMLAVCCSGDYCKVSAAPRGRILALILGQQENSEIRTLEVDTPLKREADGNALHLYRVAL